MNKGGAFILGIIALLGLAALLTRSSNRPTTLRGGEWVRQMPEEPTLHSPRVVYENEQTLTLKRGPDRLIEEIIVHRKVISHE